MTSLLFGVSPHSQRWSKAPARAPETPAFPLPQSQQPAFAGRGLSSAAALALAALALATPAKPTLSQTISHGGQMATAAHEAVATTPDGFPVTRSKTVTIAVPGIHYGRGGSIIRPAGDNRAVIDGSFTFTYTLTPDLLKQLPQRLAELTGSSEPVKLTASAADNDRLILKALTEQLTDGANDVASMPNTPQSHQALALVTGIRLTSYLGAAGVEIKDFAGTFSNLREAAAPAQGAATDTTCAQDNTICSKDGVPFSKTHAFEYQGKQVVPQMMPQYPWQPSPYRFTLTVTDPDALVAFFSGIGKPEFTLGKDAAHNNAVVGNLMKWAIERHHLEIEHDDDYPLDIAKADAYTGDTLATFAKKLGLSIENFQVIRPKTVTTPNGHHSFTQDGALTRPLGELRDSTGAPVVIEYPPDSYPTAKFRKTTPRFEILGRYSLPTDLTALMQVLPKALQEQLKPGDREQNDRVIGQFLNQRAEEALLNVFATGKESGLGRLDPAKGLLEKDMSLGAYVAYTMNERFKREGLAIEVKELKVRVDESQTKPCDAADTSCALGATPFSRSGDMAYTAKTAEFELVHPKTGVRIRRLPIVSYRYTLPTVMDQAILKLDGPTRAQLDPADREENDAVIRNVLIEGFEIAARRVIYEFVAENLQHVGKLPTDAELAAFIGQTFEDMARERFGITLENLTVTLKDTSDTI